MFDIINVTRLFVLSVVSVILMSSPQAYADDLAYNEFMAISDINALNSLNANPEAVLMARREMRDNITRHVAANLDSLIDNKFAQAKKELMANLPKVDELLPFADTMQVVKLSSDLLLISLQTYTAAYQSSGIFLVYDLKNIKLSLVPFEDGARFEFENILNYRVLTDNYIQFIAKSRGTGDCGNIITYHYVDGIFKIYKKRDFNCKNQ